MSLSSGRTIFRSTTKEKLRKTIIDTTAQLKVDLTEMEEKKKKVIFSLTKGNIDEETLNQLCEIIDKSRFSVI